MAARALSWPNQENGSNSPDPFSLLEGGVWAMGMRLEKLIPYLREKGPMGGAPYIGSRLRDGLIFKVSRSQLDEKERPGKLPT